MKRNQVFNVFCGLLVFLWVYAGVSKLSSFHIFQNQMAMQILPKLVKTILGAVLPEAEIVLAVFLAIQRFRLIALYISLVLLIAFTIYIGLAVFGFFPKRPCSCGGVFQHVGWKMHFIINVLFVAINLIAIIITQRKEAPALKSM